MKDATAGARPLLSPVQPVLPVSLAKPFSVYANNNGQLKELDQLTIKIPDQRAPISDEIITPSSTIVEGGKIAFVVLKRDFVDNAPQTATVRVVARISRRSHPTTHPPSARCPTPGPTRPHHFARASAIPSVSTPYPGKSADDSMYEL